MVQTHLPSLSHLTPSYISFPNIHGWFCPPPSPRMFLAKLRLCPYFKTIKERDVRRITAAEMNCMRRTAGYTWTDYKTNTQIKKELKITQILDKLLEYKRNQIQYLNRMPRNRLPRVMKYYSPTGSRNHGRPLKRLLDTWDRNGLTSGPTPWQIYDDDDDDRNRCPFICIWQ